MMTPVSDERSFDNKLLVLCLLGSLFIILRKTKKRNLSYFQRQIFDVKLLFEQFYFLTLLLMKNYIFIGKYYFKNPRAFFFI